MTKKLQSPNMGATKAAKQPGIRPSQIYQWRSAADKKANTSK